MEFSTPEKIGIILKRQKMTYAKLAELTNQSRQNLSQKLDRDNLSEQEIKEIAAVLGCKYESHFILPDGEIL